MNLEEARAKVAQLTEELNYHNDRYYNHDDPVISDYEYDAMLRDLENLEAQFPELLLPTSPTQRVGGSRGEKFSPVVHSVPTVTLTARCARSYRIPFMSSSRSLTDCPYPANTATVYLYAVRPAETVRQAKT